MVTGRTKGNDDQNVSSTVQNWIQRRRGGNTDSTDNNNNTNNDNDNRSRRRRRSRSQRDRSLRSSRVERISAFTEAVEAADAEDNLRRPSAISVEFSNRAEDEDYDDSDEKEMGARRVSVRSSGTRGGDKDGASGGGGGGGGKADPKLPFHWPRQGEYKSDSDSSKNYKRSILNNSAVWEDIRLSQRNLDIFGGGIGGGGGGTASLFGSMVSRSSARSYEEEDTLGTLESGKVAGGVKDGLALGSGVGDVDQGTGSADHLGSVPEKRTGVFSRFGNAFYRGGSAGSAVSNASAASTPGGNNIDSSTRGDSTKGDDDTGSIAISHLSVGDQTLHNMMATVLDEDWWKGRAKDWMSKSSKVEPVQPALLSEEDKKMNRLEGGCGDNASGKMKRRKLCGNRLHTVIWWGIAVLTFMAVIIVATTNVGDVVIESLMEVAIRTKERLANGR